jgi:hypothetical protein
MKLEFDSIAELKEFYAQLKGTRGKKGDDADDAPPASGMTAPPTVQVPAPMAIPTQQPTFNPAGFAPQAAGAGQAAPVFPVAAATGPAPEVLALVAKINERANASIGANPASLNDALKFFRDSIGPDAAQATLQQIQEHFLPRMATDKLAQLAKLMGLA